MFNLIAYVLFVFFNFAIMRAHFASIRGSAYPYVDYEHVNRRLNDIKYDLERCQINSYEAHEVERKEQIFNVTKSECRTALNFAKLVYNLYLIWESIYIIATFVFAWLLTNIGICWSADRVDIYGWIAIGVGVFGTTPFLILIIKTYKYMDFIINYDKSYNF